MLKNQETIRELKRIADNNRGLLLPENVVREAEAQESPLHAYFEWDDGKAAYAHRLQQARQLINVCVEVLPDDGRETRVFVSLRDDRTNDGGGYRTLVKVLSSAKLREQLMDDALSEMAYFNSKFKTLKELSGVFAAMDEAQLAIEAEKKSKKKVVAKRG